MTSLVYLDRGRHHFDFCSGGDRLLRRLVGQTASFRGPVALAALDRLKGRGQTMASPSNGLDIVALTFAVVLTAAIVLLFSHLMPRLADLMMPPALSGSPY